MNNKKVLFIGFSAALAGLLFGIDVGVISGALPLIKQTFNISDLMLEFITSSMLIGAAAGALISRWISYQIGREKFHYNKRNYFCCYFSYFCTGSKCSNSFNCQIFSWNRPWYRQASTHLYI